MSATAVRAFSQSINDKGSFTVNDAKQFVSGNSAAGQVCDGTADQSTQDAILDLRSMVQMSDDLKVEAGAAQTVRTCRVAADDDVYEEPEVDEGPHVNQDFQTDGYVQPFTPPLQTSSSKGMWVGGIAAATVLVGATAGGAWLGAKTCGAAGAVLGSVVPGGGTAAGAVGGGAVCGVVGGVTGFALGVKPAMAAFLAGAMFVD